MKFSTIALALCVGMTSALQTGSFEKQALASVQHMLASGLDTELPKRPFAAWFNQIIGPEAGIVWQLTECGQRIGTPGSADQDIPACTEVNASLPDGRKVIVVITVGTFKKGLTGKPEFFRAVVESDEQLYQVSRLRDLSEILLTPKERLVEKQPVDLPAVEDGQSQVRLAADITNVVLPSSAGPVTGGARSSETGPPPPPEKTQKLQRISQGVLEGSVITKVKPVYPPNAKNMNASGKVEVQIVISEEGRVIEASAVSGHPALRSAAVDAARKWVFKPTMLNGSPVRVQSILNFIFTPDTQ